MELLFSALAQKITNTISHFMGKENDNVDDIEIPEEENLMELDETTDWKLKADELQRKHRDAGIRNRERTKALKEQISSLQKPPEKKEKEQKSGEFGLLEKAFLKASGFTDADEEQLFKKWHEETNKPYDELVNHPFVKAEIEQMRTAKANKIATDDIKGENGSNKGGAKDSPDYWIAKATTNAEGKLMFPDDLPKDRKLRASIAEKLIQKQKVGKMFYNE